MVSRPFVSGWQTCHDSFTGIAFVLCILYTKIWLY